MLHRPHSVLVRGSKAYFGIGGFPRSVARTLQRVGLSRTTGDGDRHGVGCGSRGETDRDGWPPTARKILPYRARIIGTGRNPELIRCLSDSDVHSGFLLEGRRPGVPGFARKGGGVHGT
jgi:hypothetical protein